MLEAGVRPYAHFAEQAKQPEKQGIHPLNALRQAILEEDKQSIYDALYELNMRITGKLYGHFQEDPDTLQEIDEMISGFFNEYNNFGDATACFYLGDSGYSRIIIGKEGEIERSTVSIELSPVSTIEAQEKWEILKQEAASTLK